MLGPSGSVAPQRGTWSAPVGFPLVPVAAAHAAQRQDADLVGVRGGHVRRRPAARPSPPSTTRPPAWSPSGRSPRPGTTCSAPASRCCRTAGSWSPAATTAPKTSIYNPATDAWTSGPNMVTPRGYQASATLSDGRVFTIGGSWSGRSAARCTPTRTARSGPPATGWHGPARRVGRADADRGPNPNGVYRADNHAWLFAWTGGRVLQAGPSKAMNWYATTGTGSVTAAGTRADDADAMNGNAVMYDAGKILTSAARRVRAASTRPPTPTSSTISGTAVTSRKVASMANARAFHNSVVLPDGKVVVFGGAELPGAVLRQHRGAQRRSCGIRPPRRSPRWRRRRCRGRTTAWLC